MCKTEEKGALTPCKIYATDKKKRFRGGVLVGGERGKGARTCHVPEDIDARYQLSNL